MSAASRRAGRSDRGVAALEFALIAPVFFSLLLGIIIYGVYFASLIAVTEIAEETSRAAIAGLTTTEQTSLAQTRYSQVIASYSPLLTSTNGTLTVSFPSAGTISVQVVYNFASFGFTSISLLPVPTITPSVTVQVSTGSP